MGNFFRSMKFLMKSPRSKLCWFYTVHWVFCYVKSLVILHSKTVLYRVQSPELICENILHLMNSWDCVQSLELTFEIFINEKITFIYRWNFMRLCKITRANFFLKNSPAANFEKSHQTETNARLHSSRSRWRTL